jgi:diguanylate cyclase (GGDEF) domain
MPKNYFENIFRNMNLPVIVCHNDIRNTIVYANNNAKISYNPLLNLKNLQDEMYLKDFINFTDKNMIDILRNTLNAIDSINDFIVNITTYDNRTENISITANRVVFDDTNGNELNDYFVIYTNNVSEIVKAHSDITNILSAVYHVAYHTLNIDIDEAINKILHLMGNYIRVSRVYIFEETSSVMTRNTYEWCDNLTEPTIQDLQFLPKKDYNYDLIMNNGMYITDDIRELPQIDFEILDAQGIKSLAIIPLFNGKKGLGYIGYDDCVNYRTWSPNEILLLTSASDVIVSLIERRNFAQQEARSLAVLETISDYIDNNIYVNDRETHEIIFVNNALAKSLNMVPEDIIGRKCWQVFQKNNDKPCDFCPVQYMVDENNNIITPDYSWEFKNTVNGHWYKIKDSIIKWTDGRDVHIETSIDITEQKTNEDQLLYSASTDSMTGTYNRKWGYKLLTEIIEDRRYTKEIISLCFIDIDGLKSVNDTYGHDEGDNMILTLVNTLRKCVRKSDIICRWGGDEFLLILRNCKIEVVDKIMTKTYSELDIINSGRNYNISFSYGTAALPYGNDVIIDNIITEADKLMYSQKQKKKKARE